MEFSKHLSFRHDLIEGLVEAREDFYPGLKEEALYTSLEDLEKIFKHPLVQGTWVDLGAGVGQTVLAYALKHPEQTSIGIEGSLARVKAGREKIFELGVQNAQLIHGDLLDCNIPSAQVYFLYFPTGHVLDRILDALSQKLTNFILVAVESHGDLLDRLAHEDWLIRTAEIPLTGKRHYPNAVIFEHKISPFKISFRNKILLIQEEEKIWLGDSLGLSHLKDEFFNLLHPPRTITWSQVKDIKDEEAFPPQLRFALNLRRKGEFSFQTRSSHFHGQIRKIIVGPSFSVELSSGETIEWQQIQVIKQGTLLCFDSSSPDSFY